MPENNLEIIDKKNISQLIKELQYLDDEILSKATGLKPELSLILFKLEKLKPELDNTGRYLYDAVTNIAASRKEESAFLKRMETFQNTLDELSASFHVQHNGNLRLQSEQVKVIDYLENFDTSLMQMVIKDEITKLRKQTVNEVKSNLEKEFSNQKTRLIYLFGGGISLFILGLFSSMLLLKYM